MITGVVACIRLLLHAVKGNGYVSTFGTFCTDRGFVLYELLVDRGSKR